MLPPETGLEGSTLSTARDSPRSRDEVHAEGVDEGALAHARHAGDADAVRMAGVRQDGVQQAGRQLGIPRQIALDQRDGAGEDDAVAAEDAGEVAVEGQPAGVGVGHRGRANSFLASHAKPDKLQTA